MRGMLAAELTEFGKFQTTGGLFLVLRGHIVAIFAFTALQYYIISWHIHSPQIIFAAAGNLLPPRLLTTQ
jgi:hypothetical protein